MDINSIEAAILRDCTYDSETGFVYKNGARVVGYRTQGRTTYERMYVLSTQLASHRIAWFLHYGSWPKGQIDHIDGDGLNNRISNLRDVSQSENMKNKRRYAKNRDLPVGIVRRHRKTGPPRYRCQIGVNGVTVLSRRFDTIEEAVEERKRLLVVHGYHQLHSEK